MNYPEEIYPTHSPSNWSEVKNVAEHTYNHEKRDGLAETAQWVSLTKAIQNNENIIDWEQLDGVRAKCVHKNGIEITHKLEYDPCYEIVAISDWYDVNADDVWTNALGRAWRGLMGWELFIAGDIPLKTKTADTLPLGMCFRGYVPVGDDEIRKEKYLQIMLDATFGRVVISYDSNNLTVKDCYNPQKVGVIETYGIGTFKKETD